MFKLRMSVAVPCVLISVTCAVWALTKDPTPKQKKAMDKCDQDYSNILLGCDQDPIGKIRDQCYDDAWAFLEQCYKVAGISTPPRNPHLPPNVPTTELQPTSSPASSPKRKLPPTGPLTQASPTATPKRLVRQPQGTLTQASPSASPNKILSATPKKSPSPTTQKKKH